jgi:hypothetical protein
MTIVKPYPTVKENSHLNNKIDFRMGFFILYVEIYKKTVCCPQYPHTRYLYVLDYSWTLNV